jgi:hypothetical protein
MNNELAASKDERFFVHNTVKIQKITPNNNYTLTLLFDNGEIRVYDLSNNLYGVFEILKDINKFNEVFIDESGNIAWDRDKNIDSNIFWNNRIDICKDAAYMDSVPIQKPGAQ